MNRRDPDVCTYAEDVLYDPLCWFPYLVNACSLTMSLARLLQVVNRVIPLAQPCV